VVPTTRPSLSQNRSFPAVLRLIRTATLEVTALAGDVPIGLIDTRFGLSSALGGAGVILWASWW